MKTTTNYTNVSFYFDRVNMEPANGANVALIYETRNYQEEILQIALQENVIIYLPTGSGKTYIVTLLIRELGECLESGKRTFFLVNTVPLVEQQANALAAHLPYNIGRFTGDMNLDGWREQQWRQEMDSYPIIVMTTQIFLNIIQHNFYSLEYVNLLIFDECHNASNDHAMRQLAKLFNSKFNLRLFYFFNFSKSLSVSTLITISQLIRCSRRLDATNCRFDSNPVE